MNLTGRSPDDLGVADNQLRLCPDTPNCVCSYEPAERTQHAIAALDVSTAAEAPLDQLTALVKSLPRTKVVRVTENYLHVEFTSFLLRFVDDVEFQWRPDQGLIHVRSASRVGKSDLGVNRKRVERIRALWEQEKSS